MRCAKDFKRTIFNLFTIYTCDKCSHKESDESFVIGTNALHIYCINGCDKEKINDDLINISDKLKILLRDFCMHYDNNILLWMDTIEPLEKYEEDIEVLFKMNMHIHIIKW